MSNLRSSKKFITYITIVCSKVFHTFTTFQSSQLVSKFEKKRMMKAQKIILNTVLPEAKNGQHCKKAWAPQEGEPQLANAPKVSYTSTIATSKVCEPLFMMSWRSKKCIPGKSSWKQKSFLNLWEMVELAFVADSWVPGTTTASEATVVGGHNTVGIYWRIRVCPPRPRRTWGTHERRTGWQGGHPIVITMGKAMPSFRGRRQQVARIHTCVPGRRFGLKG